MSQDDDTDYLLCSEVMRPSSSSPVYDQQICCLLDSGQRCEKIAGNASYNKRVQKIDIQKKLRLSLDGNAHHLYICDQHKSIIQSVRAKRKRRASPAVTSVPSTNTQMHSDILYPSCSQTLGPPPQVLGSGPSYQPHQHFAPTLSSLDTSVPASSVSASQEPVPEVNFRMLSVNALRRYRKFFKLQTVTGPGKASLADAVSQDFRTLQVSEKDILTYFIYMIKTGASKLDGEPMDMK